MTCLHTIDEAVHRTIRGNSGGRRYDQWFMTALGFATILAGILIGASPLQARQLIVAQRLMPLSAGAKRTVTSNAQAPPPRTVPTYSLGTAYIHSLTAVASGPGVIVTEPLARDVNNDAVVFGVGCSRWLQFALAGTSALGKTPLLGQINRVRREMAKANLRLNAKEAERAGKLLGVTHVAVGNMTGIPGHHVLTYRLWSVRTGAPVGKAISVTGSDDQIVAAIPRMARQLCIELGVASTQIPASMGATATEISQVGRVSWVADASFTTSSAEPLLNLSHHLPLAGIWLLGSGLLQDDEQEQALVKDLLARVPHNPLVYCEIANHGTDLLIPYRGDLERERKRSPNNYLLAQASTWMQEKSNDEVAARQAAEQAARCAPNNPDAWLTLAGSISNATEDLRHGRTADQISNQDWAILNQFYARWYATTAKATALDPGYGKAWLRLAMAATFAGNETTANTAFWKAVHLDRGNLAEVYNWGMEMYQPKWNDDEKKLVQVIRLAALTHYTYAGETVAVAEEMRQLGLDKLAKTMVTQVIADRQKVIRRSPKDPQAHYDLALALKDQNRPVEAAAEMQSFIALKPHFAESQFWLGQLWEQQKKWELAIAEFRETIRLRPYDAKAHEELGTTLTITNHSTEAEKELREAVQLEPDSATAHMSLGEVLGPNRSAEAITELKEALRLDPSNPQAWFDLSYKYASEGKYAEAITAIKQGISLAPDDNVAHANLADDYNQAGDHADAAAEYREALRLTPEDIMLHEKLGDTLLAIGKLAEARAEWTQVIAAFSTSAPALAEEARKQLEEHPMPGPRAEPSSK